MERVSLSLSIGTRSETNRHSSRVCGVSAAPTAQVAHRRADSKSPLANICLDRATASVARFRQSRTECSSAPQRRQGSSRASSPRSLARHTGHWASRIPVSGDIEENILELPANAVDCGKVHGRKRRVQTRRKSRELFAVLGVQFVHFSMRCCDECQRLVP